jgi:serine/threonine protein kinase
MNENANTLGIFTQTVPRMACPHCDAELDVSEFGVFEDIECPSCNEVIKVPGRLGDFILIDELGRGAMGCVYLAQDESLGRLVALKVIRKEFGEDPKMLETVQREAKAMATLNHRNICQVYSFGRAEKQPYFVMELLTGERLDEMLEEHGAVSEIRALEIAHDVAQGLDAADKAGLTHGDIKPANILMNENGVAKVVDFGLARFMDPDAEIEVWGTPYYIAPEKARKKGEDSRSDQYSLGATLFHVMAGHTPFEGENPTKVVIASLKEDTPELKDHNPEVTDKTSAVIRRMMDKSPNRRYPTYASLLADIDLALQTAKEA